MAEKSIHCAAAWHVTASKHCESGRFQLRQFWNWRSGWDSNPRKTFAFGGFQDLCLKPLGHRSTFLRPKRRTGRKIGANIKPRRMHFLFISNPCPSMHSKFQDRCIQPLCLSLRIDLRRQVASWRRFSADFFCVVGNFRLLPRKSNYFQDRA